MAISTLAGLVAAQTQRRQIYKTSTGTTPPVGQFKSLLAYGPVPAAGTLSLSATTSGALVTNTGMAGFPVIRPFTSGHKGYLSAVTFEHAFWGGTVTLFDRIWHGGSYAWQSAYTLSGWPTITGRIPDGTDWGPIELWLEVVNAGAGTYNVVITYTNEAGTTGKTTGTVVYGTNATTFPVARLYPVPLASGDKGVQKVESVTTTTATDGFFNLLLLRRLCTLSSGRATDGTLPVGEVRHDMLKTGLVEVFDSSAIMACFNSLGGVTAQGIDMELEIVSG